MLTARIAIKLRTAYNLEDVSKILWWIAVILQVLVARFTQLVLTNKVQATTYFAPPLMSGPAIVAITGDAYVSNAMQVASFGVSFAVAIILLPLMTRAAIKSDLVASGPAVALITVPCSIVTSAFFKVCGDIVDGRCTRNAFLHPAIGSTTLVISILYVFIAGYLIQRRRDAIISSWFTPAWGLSP